MNIESGDVASWATLLFSVVTAAAAGGAFLGLRKRERRLALADLHTALTTGETAAARNTIGTLLYAAAPKDRPSRHECIRAYFSLIWAVQGARNVFRAQLLPNKQLDAPLSRWEEITRRRHMKDAAAALTWNLSEISENLVRFHDFYGSVWGVQDRDAWEEIGVFVNADAIRRRGRTPADDRTR